MQLAVDDLNPPFGQALDPTSAATRVGKKNSLQAADADATDRQLECATVLFCDIRFASDVKTDRVLNRYVDAAKALLAEAGYDGTPVHLMHVTDIASQEIFLVLKPMLVEAGFVVDSRPADWFLSLADAAEKLET